MLLHSTLGTPSILSICAFLRPSYGVQLTNCNLYLPHHPLNLSRSPRFVLDNLRIPQTRSSIISSSHLPRGITQRVPKSGTPISLVNSTQEAFDIERIALILIENHLFRSHFASLNFRPRRRLKEPPSPLPLALRGFAIAMSGNYQGRRGPNVAHYLQDLNTIPTEEPIVDNFNPDDLALFTNGSQFFDFAGAEQGDSIDPSLKDEGLDLFSGKITIT